MVVLKCCGNELTKRVPSTLSPVLAQCGLNLPKVSKSKIKAKQLVLSNATERSDLSITTARATQFALQTTHHTQNLKGKTFQLPRSCSVSQKIFLWQQLRFGQQYAATPQISPTRCRFEFLARCDAGGCQSCVVGLFTQSCSFRCPLPTLRRKYTGVQTEYTNCLDGGTTSCL